MKDRREVLENLEAAVNDVLSLVEEPHQQELSSQLQSLTHRYDILHFNASCYPVDRWLDDRSSQLAQMAPTGVLVSPLQEQIRDLQEFQKTVENYKPEIESVGSLATVCDQSASSVGEADQSGESPPNSKMEVVWHRYDDLKAVAVLRLSMLSSFVPTVQQYESSQSAWATLLCGWEEKAAILPPPGARPETIQEQLDDIKVN